MRDHKTPHLFVISHEGVTSYKGKRTGSLVLRQFLPLMALSGVTALFSGHDHHYVRGRTWVGIPFFISGGGGGALYDIRPGGVFAELAGSVESSFKGGHVLVMDVFGDRCSVEAVDERGEVIDRADLGSRQ
jgi:hypothetical protein